MSILQRLFRKNEAAHAARVPWSVGPCPEEPLFLVPDLHGRLDLLDLVLDKKQRHHPQARLIVLGDMIDRGPDSRGVLARLMDRDDESTVCLMGNHEFMLLNALDDPETQLKPWLRHGGLETCWSFGLKDVPGHPAEFADRLRSAIGAEVLLWLRSRAHFWTSGTLVAVHAALDPDLTVFDQAPDVMLWGHPLFDRKLRADGIWVAYGHKVVPSASCADGRIALDTGAYATNRLSFAVIDPSLPEENRVTLSEVTGLK